MKRLSFMLDKKTILIIACMLGISVLLFMLYRAQLAKNTSNNIIDEFNTANNSLAAAKDSLSALAAYRGHEGFKFSYSDYGLGSNRGKPSDLVVAIADTTLTYLIYENTSEFKIEPPFQDTVWTTKRMSYDVPLRKTSIDSIIKTLNGKEGKYIFASNPHVMSGSIQQLYIEYKDWCTEFSLKNTFDSTAMNIVNIVNRYLPKDNRIYIPYDLWTDRNNAPLIKSCPSEPNQKYSDILGDEYDLIRQNKK